MDGDWILRARQRADFLTYLLVRALVCIVQAVPLSAFDALSRWSAWLCWDVLRFRRAVIEENLRHAFPEKSLAERNAIAVAMWKHLVLMVAEIAHAPRKVRRTTWRRYSSIPSMKEILTRMLDERPVVIISGHLGNFEMGGYLLALHGFPTHTVARPLDNPYLDRYVTRFRETTGQFMLPMHGSSKRVSEVLEAGGTIALLGDQYAGRGGQWVDFFGRPASTHKAVAVLTLTSQAPTAVSAALRRDAPLNIAMEVADIVDPQDDVFSLSTIPLLTNWYTRHLEQLIRSRPEQYWWVHRRWKGNPSARRAWRQKRRGEKAA